MSKRKKLLFSIKVMTLLVTLCTGAFAAFCVTVINSIDLEKILMSTAPQARELNAPDKIEQGSLTRKQDLLTYWTWTKYDQGLDTFLSENKEKWQYPNKKEVYWQEDLPLPNLRSNDCETIYCLQSRLRFPEIPSLLWRGLIGIEDYRFLNHSGVDLRALLRALWHDLKVMRLEQGGSTLTQQLVKNIFYTNEKKFSRKIKEMIASTYIEFKLEKEQILQAYFNEVMWGSLQGIRIKGIAAASLFYFKKKPQNLTPYEVSILISLLKGPYYYSPVNKVERLKSRANLVFNKLKDLNLFSDNSSLWSENKWLEWHQDILSSAKGTDLKSLYFLTKLNSKQRNYSTYIFLKEVEEMKNQLRTKYPKSDLAIKVYRKETEDKSATPFAHYTKYERSLRTAIEDEQHQVGSTLKPIIYFLLEKNGLDMSSSVETDPLTLSLKSGDWSPKESHKGIPEKVSYEEALIQSLNRPVIKAVQEYGFEKFEKLLSEEIPRLKTPLAEYPAQLLGAVELSISELASVYENFISRSCLQKDSSRVLLALSDPTKTTIRFRVGNKLGQMRFFGKTGTSNNGFDSWFVGYEGSELLVVWVGLEGRRDTEKEFKLYGSNSSFVIYKNYYRYRGKLFNEMPCQ